jgi:hypothetical protein
MTGKIIMDKNSSKRMTGASRSGVDILTMEQRQQFKQMREEIARARQTRKKK